MTEGDEIIDPARILRIFFDRQQAEDREWLVVLCVMTLDDRIWPVENSEKAEAWLVSWFEMAPTGYRLFGRVVSIISIFDFELSPLALMQFKERAEHFRDSDKENWRALAQSMFKTLARREAMMAAWLQLRADVLSDATLMAWREVAARLGDRWTQPLQ